MPLGRQELRNDFLVAHDLDSEFFDILHDPGQQAVIVAVLYGRKDGLGASVELFRGVNVLFGHAAGHHQTTDSHQAHLCEDHRDRHGIGDFLHGDAFFQIGGVVLRQQIHFRRRRLFFDHRLQDLEGQRAFSGDESQMSGVHRSALRARRSAPAKNRILGSQAPRTGGMCPACPKERPIDMTT